LGEKRRYRSKGGKQNTACRQEVVGGSDIFQHEEEGKGLGTSKKEEKKRLTAVFRKGKAVCRGQEGGIREGGGEKEGKNIREGR